MNLRVWGAPLPSWQVFHTLWVTERLLMRKERPLSKGRGNISPESPPLIKIRNKKGGQGHPRQVSFPPSVKGEEVSTSAQGQPCLNYY